MLPFLVPGLRQVDVRGVCEAEDEQGCRVEEAEDYAVDDVAAVGGYGGGEVDDEGAEAVDWVVGR